MEVNPQCAPCYLGISHSPLVTHVIKAAMSLLDVPESHRVLLGRRHVYPPESPNSLDAISDDMESAFKDYSRERYASALERLRNVLEREAHAGFIAVVPHSNQIIYQEITSHPLCMGYYYAEEGFTSMCWEACNARRVKLSAFLKCRGRRWFTGSRFDCRRLMFDAENPRYLGAFAISGEAFRGLGNVVNVAGHLPAANPSHGRRRIFVVLDALYLHDGVDWNDYREALVNCLREHLGGAEEIFLKFHFAETRVAERFASIQKEIPNWAVKLLGPGFCIEDELRQDDLVIYGSSSLGYYARLFKCETETFIDRLVNIDIEARVASGKLPFSFLEIVREKRELRYGSDSASR